MKLQDLAAQAQTKQVAKVMESYFGQEIDFNRLNRTQARNMLNRVRAMISEARRSPDFHRSEQNPAYLKLVMMEQGLSHRIREEVSGGSTGGTVNVGPVTATTTAGQAPAQSAAQATAMQATQQAQKRKQITDQIKALDMQRANINRQRMDLQKQLGMLESGHSLRRKLKESEVQQAQVVLASQDMVDQVQKMIEQVTAMQYKDLPALVDSIKNEVGVEQSAQFNTDATAALTGLVQNLQGSKQQLEQALGVVTGQAPVVPGADMSAELPAPVPGEEIDVDTDIDVEEPASDLETTLGRGKR